MYLQEAMSKDQVDFTAGTNSVESDSVVTELPIA